MQQKWSWPQFVSLVEVVPASDEDGVEVQKLEGFEERIGEGEEPAADAQGTEAIVINQKVKGKKQQQQQHHQRQQTDPKKPRKEHEIEQKQVGLNTGKDSTAQGEAAGGRMQRCKQPVVQTTLAWRATQQPPQLQPQPMPQSQSELPQPLAHRRQRRMPRTFSIPIEELEGGLRSLTRYLSSASLHLLSLAISWLLWLPTSHASRLNSSQSAGLYHRLLV